jgi:hypothetical protein
MSIATYASYQLAAEMLRSHNYKTGLVPVIDAERSQFDEFVVRVAAEDPVFTWETKKDGSERFPVGFMYSKLLDGSYVILPNEDESAVDLAERVSSLATAYAEREASASLALTA